MASRAPFAFALVAIVVVGCSLTVDTQGLSAGPSTSVPGGDATVDAPSGDRDSSSNADATGGDDAGADAPVEGGPKVCPGGRGPAMLRVSDVYGSFCIDTTEVTNTQFNVFLADSARPTPPSVCAYRTSYGGATRPANTLPVVDVDWCEAWVFCAWAGKRLCGSRNGTVISNEQPANSPKVSEWYAACSHSGDTIYPYGNSPDKTRCNGCDRDDQCNTDAGVPGLAPVGSLPFEGGYPGIFDMSGNVGEWEDNCDSDTSSSAGHTCPPRGGDRSLGVSRGACKVGSIPAYADRDDRAPVTGIRCCAD
jgi:formylglycine-generating enzyme required for sulfatase activity